MDWHDYTIDDAIFAPIHLIVFSVILCLLFELIDCKTSPDCDKSIEEFNQKEVESLISDLNEKGFHISSSGWLFYVREDDSIKAYVLEDRWIVNSTIDFNNEQKGDENVLY